MREYTIAGAFDMDVLIKDVNLLLRDGWELLGGVCVRTWHMEDDEDRIEMFQAMSREKPAQ